MTKSAQPFALSAAHARVAEWWRTARPSWRHLLHPGSASTGDVDRLAGEVGLTATALTALASTPSGLPMLLGRRLAALGLDPAEIERLSPRLLADLERTCNACPDRQRCIDDMVLDPLAPGWESYCPNSGTLATL